MIFVGVVSDAQWERFCTVFGLEAFAADESLRLNSDRVRARDRIMPVLQSLFSSMSRDELMLKLEQSGLPFAPIAKPEDLFDDPHLQASGGLIPITLPNGVVAELPALPIAFDEKRFGLRQDLAAAGHH